MEGVPKVHFTNISQEMERQQTRRLKRRRDFKIALPWPVLPMVTTSSARTPKGLWVWFPVEGLDLTLLTQILQGAHTWWGRRGKKGEIASADETEKVVLETIKEI